MIITSNTVLKGLLIFFLVIAGLYYGKLFLMPLAMGAVLATLFLPLCTWFERKKAPRGLAVLLCLLVILAFMAAVGVLVGWQISEIASNISEIKQKSEEMRVQIQSYIAEQLNLSISRQKQLIEGQQISASNILRTVMGSLKYILVNLLLTLVYFFLLLYYRNHIRQFFLKFSAADQQKATGEVIDNAALVSQQYFIGLIKMIGCLWIMYSIGFSLAGVKNAVFYAILCGILEIIPYIGNITGTLFTLLMSAVQGASPAMLGGIVLVYGLVQTIQGWILEPVIVGPQVKINPMFTIIALVGGELLWGIPGVILAIPLTAIAKIVCDHVEPLKPYGFLIGQTPTRKKRFFLKRKQDK